MKVYNLKIDNQTIQSKKFARELGRQSRFFGDNVAVCPFDESDEKWEFYMGYYEINHVDFKKKEV